MGSSTHAKSVAGETSPGLILIDDDPLISESLEFVLRKDFSVQVVASRKQARDLLRKMKVMPALALVDLGLPPTPHSPEEGFSLITELLTVHPDMKILVLSGQNERTNVQHALSLGAVDFIPKPCDVELLRRDWRAREDSNSQPSDP